MQNMTDEALQQLLNEIAALSDREELTDLLQEMAIRFDAYQKEQLGLIQKEVEQSLMQYDADSGIDMIMCKKEEVYQYEEWFSTACSTGLFDVTWGIGPVFRVYIELANEEIEEYLSKGNCFKAEAITNYESYPITVCLKKYMGVLEKTEALDNVIRNNRMDIPEINTIYADKFFDVCFCETKDRLRDDEKLVDIKVEWGELEEFIKTDRILLWNVFEVAHTEQSFPERIPVGDSVQYLHEIWLKDDENTYMIDTSEIVPLQIKRMKEMLYVTTPKENYQNWKLYQLRSIPEFVYEKRKVMTNQYCGFSFMGAASRVNVMTRAGLYETLSSYRLMTYFEQLDISEEGEIKFMPKDPGWFANREMMEYILRDLDILYPNYKLKGMLIEHGV